MINNELKLRVIIEKYLEYERRFGFGMAFCKTGEEYFLRVEFWKWIVYIGLLWNDYSDWDDDWEDVEF